MATVVNRVGSSEAPTVAALSLMGDGLGEVQQLLNKVDALGGVVGISAEALASAVSPLTAEIIYNTNEMGLTLSPVGAVALLDFSTHPLAI